MRLAPLLLLTTAALPAAAQVNVETEKRVVQALASDAFEGRAPGTAGEEKTIALLVDEFTRLGLRPGNNGSWTQTVPMVELTHNLDEHEYPGGRNFGHPAYGAGARLPLLNI